MADGEAGEGRANLYQPAEAAVFWALGRQGGGHEGSALAGDLDDGPDAVAVVEHDGAQVVAEKVGDLIE